MTSTDHAPISAPLAPGDMYMVMLDLAGAVDPPRQHDRWTALYQPDDPDGPLLTVTSETSTLPHAAIILGGAQNVPVVVEVRIRPAFHGERGRVSGVHDSGHAPARFHGRQSDARAARKASVMTDQTVFYAWCFDHGRMHTFDNQPWCTATWVALSGNTVEEATADKTARFGEAVFMHDMRLEVQGDILKIANQAGSRT